MKPRNGCVESLAVVDDRKALSEKVKLEKQSRSVECAKAIEAALKKYDCSMSGVPVITPEGKLSANILINANE